MENKDFENDFILSVDEQPEETVDLFSTASGYRTHRFKKKKRGLARFLGQIGEKIATWWSNLKKWQKVTVISLSSVTAVILVGVILLFSLFGYNYNDISNKPDDLGFETVINEKVVNIALFGIDTRNPKTFKGNSDSIMILSLNTETKKVKIVSIMRDSLVKIDTSYGVRYRKVNSAYATGGPELAIKTLNQNFGLDISEYATVNFFGMADIIDAVGGIDAELTQSEVGDASRSSTLNGCIKNICKSLKVDPKPHYITGYGKKHLNGIQAVAYSRIRKHVNIWGTNNDFGRTDRQRYVMEQLFNKALTMKKSQYVKLAKSLIPCSETSLSYGEIMELAVNILLHSPKFEQTRMPLNEYQMKAPYIRGVGSTVYYDLAFATDLLHAFFYDDVSPEKYVEINGIGKNDWYAQISNSNSTTSKVASKRPSTNHTTSKSQTTSSNTVSDSQTSSKTNSGSSVVSSQVTTSSESVVSSDLQTSSTNSTTSSQIASSSDLQSGSSSKDTTTQVETPDGSQTGTGEDNSSNTTTTPETPDTQTSQTPTSSVKSESTTPQTPTP